MATSAHSSPSLSSLWVIVPVKAFEASKQRLATILDQEQRRALAELLFDDLLQVLRAVAPAGVLVATASDAVATRAGQRGAEVLRQRGSGLNNAITQSWSELAQRGIASTAVLPIDLPLVRAEALRRLFEEQLADSNCDVTIVPDRHHQGTNLLIAPPARFRPAYGPGSARRHRIAAERAGLRTMVRHCPGLALDLDTDDDLLELLRDSHEPDDHEPPPGGALGFLRGDIALRRKLQQIPV